MNDPRESIIRQLLDPGVVAVVRAPGPEPIPHLIDALLAGGVCAVEITMTTPGALAALEQASRQAPPELLLGVGTVLDAATARAAIEAGARFVVTPILRPEVVPVAHQQGCPVMLGAYTPTEAQAAHEAGADFVKLFPADDLGPGYIKALRAPLPHLRLVPTGGVDADNAAAFIRAGCAAVGAGSSLVPAAALRSGDWEEITRRARAFVAAVQTGRGSAT
jgi:2-dehydro-3-deoxyphosphogluconate aldolase/(4S)-4-hydroxy-2-oxoglutarate aldolase